MSYHNSKAIVKNTVFLYVRMFVTMAISLFTVRIVLQTLGAIDYGVYNVIGGIVTSLAFISHVLSNASQRFFSVGIGKDDMMLRQVFGLIILAYVFTAVLVFIAAETIGVWFFYNKMDIPPERMEAALIVFQFSVASFLWELLTSPYNAMIIANERMHIYAYVSILQAVLKLGIVCLLVVLPYDKLEVYAILMFIVTSLTNSIYIVFCRRNFVATKLTFQWDKDVFKSIFSYSSWTLLGTLAYIFNTQGLNILFNLFFGPIANAAYAIGDQVKTTITSFAANFFMATRPPMMKSYSECDYVYTRNLFYFSSKVIFSLLFVIVVPVFVKTEFILALWLERVELYMPTFVRLMLIYSIILCVSEPITAIVQAAGKVKIYHGVVDTFTLLTLPLSYLSFKIGMEPHYGFVISILIFIMAHIMRLLILKSFFEYSIIQYLKIFVSPTLISIFLTAIVILGFQFLIPNPFVVIFASFLVSCISLYYVLFNHVERIYVVNIVKAKICKRHE